MKKLTPCLAFAALCFFTQTTAIADENSERYVAVPNGSGVGIWVVDTKTGKTKLCYGDGAQGQYTARCTDWTD